MARITISRITDVYKKEYKRGMASVVSQLSDIGYHALEYAREKKGYEDRTRNLYASYACAVYLNGKIVEGSIRFLTRATPSKHPDYSQNGRQMAESYLRSQKPRSNVEVLCVAAMPYAEYLEEGRHRGRYEIQVISAATDYLDANKNKINWGIFGGYKYARVIGGDVQYGRV